MESQIEFRVRKISDNSIVGHQAIAKGRMAHFTDGIYLEQWTTFKDVAGSKIYTGDVITAGHPNNKVAAYTGTVIFDAGCFSLLITKTNGFGYDVSSKPPLYDLCNFKILKLMPVRVFQP